jgi:hypothetical protein
MGFNDLFCTVRVNSIQALIYGGIWGIYSTKSRNVKGEKKEKKEGRTREKRMGEKRRKKEFESWLKLVESRSKSS